MKIFKYELPLPDTGVRFTIAMPLHAKLLDCQLQREQSVMWALVDESFALEDRDFVIFGTGREIAPEEGEALRHVATFQQEGYVWHVFERIKLHRGPG